MHLTRSYDINFPSYLTLLYLKNIFVMVGPLHSALHVATCGCGTLLLSSSCAPGGPRSVDLPTALMSGLSLGFFVLVVRYMTKMSLAEIIVLRWMCGKTRKDQK